MRRSFLLVLVAIVALSGCRIFGSGIPCEGSPDCPTRFPVCSEREDGRYCVGEGEGPPVEGGDDGGVVPHDSGPPPLDGGVDVDGGADVDSGAPEEDAGGPEEDGGPDGGLVVEPCELLSVSNVTPLCVDVAVPGSFSVTVEGDGFVVLSSGERPRVLVDAGGASVEATSVNATGCTRLLGGDDLCTTLTATFTAALALGDYELFVENPPLLGCDSTIGTLSVKRTPLITAAPEKICPGSPIVLEGEHFGASPVVRVNGIEADENVSISDAKMRARFYEMPFGGEVQLELDNGGCVTTTVLPTGPAVPFEQVFPTVLFEPDGNDLFLLVQADVAWTSPTALLTDGTSEWGLQPSNGFTPFDGIMLFDVPTGSLPPGSYTLQVEPSAGACRIEVPHGLTVPNGIAGDLVSSIGQTASSSPEVNNALTITAWPWADPLSPDLYGPHFLHVFLQGPTQVFPLIATVNPGGDLAFEISGSALTPGSYTMYASDTHGVVRRVPQPLLVHAGPPMVLGDVSPTVLPIDRSVTLSLRGEHLMTEGTSASFASLLCWEETAGDGAGGFVSRDGSGAPLTPAGGAYSVTVSAGPSSDGCLLSVRRDDGAQALFTGLSRPSSSGPVAFRPAPPLPTPRAGLAAATLRSKAGWGLAYAVGGADAGGTLDVVESLRATSVLTEQWRTQAALPTPLDATAAVGVNRTLLVIGGFDGTEARSEVWRAEALPKESAPTVSSTEVRNDGAAPGLDPGHYHYRVSAVRPGAGPWPGEGAASDVIAVQVRPEVPQPRAVTLNWTQVADAVAYRVYRTASPGDAPDTMTLLAETTSTSFVDGGNSEQATSRAPRLENDLSDFVYFATLVTARLAHAAVAVNNSDGSHSLFVMGGAASPGDATLASVERFGLAYGPAGVLEVTSHTSLDDLSPARRGLAAFVIDGTVREGYSGDPVVFAGPGLAADGSSTNLFETHLTDGGSTWTLSPLPVLPAPFGYAFAYHGYNVVLIGGYESDLSTSVRIGDPCSNDMCPNLQSFEVATGSLTTARTRAAAVTVGGRVLVIGGEDTAGPLSSVEMTGPPQ